MIIRLIVSSVYSDLESYVIIGLIILYQQSAIVYNLLFRRKSHYSLRSRYFLLSLFLLGGVTLSGQDDVGSWSTIQVKKIFDDKWSVRVRPILRTRNNLTEYSNTSIDLALGYNVNKHLAFEVMQRRFFLKDQGDREFFFIDTKMSHSLSSKLSWKNTFRVHIATDLNRRDPELIRWLPTLHYATGNKQKAFVGLDFFYRITDVRQLIAVRYMAGYDKKLGAGYGLNIQYWYQKGYSDLPLRTSHVIVWTLSKTFGASPSPTADAGG